MQDYHVDDLLDAYVLGALEPDEVARVEQHLAGCERCRALVSESSAVAEQLLYVAPLVAPPPSLRAHILARIESSASATEVAPLADDHAHPAGLAASAAEDERAATTAPSGPVRRLLRRLLAVDDEEIAAERLLGELMADPACIVWPVPATGEMPGASARLVGTPSRREAVLVTNGLQPVPASQAYQVWFLRGGQPQPNALFRVTGRGQACTRVRASGAVSTFDLVAITPEPATGSPSPTGPIVLAGPLTREE